MTEVGRRDEGSGDRGVLPLHEFFHLDVRSLALLRVCLALLLIWDWTDRLPDLAAHYSDQGVAPRSAITVLVPMSIHFFSGEVWYQALLAGIALVFAFALLVGYYTPLVTLVSWFLVLSVQARNPAVMQGLDVILRMLLFWGLFLPLGACWSVDSASPTGRPASPRVVSPGSVALIVQ